MCACLAVSSWKQLSGNHGTIAKKAQDRILMKIDLFLTATYRSFGLDEMGKLGLVTERPVR
jgi:hypothetical protein